MQVQKVTLHVTSVAEATMTGLGCALVVAHLQIQLALVGSQLLVGEATLILIRHLRAQAGAVVFWMFLSNSSQRVQRQCDLGDVPSLEQIRRLENFLLWYAILLDGRLEPLDVLHQLEVGTPLLDFLHRSGSQLVYQFAQHHSVPEYILVGTGR